MIILHIDLKMIFNKFLHFTHLLSYHKVHQDALELQKSMLKNNMGIIPFVLY